MLAASRLLLRLRLLDAPLRFKLPVLVPPIPEEQKAANFNTLRTRVVTIGCMHLFKAGSRSTIVSSQAERSFTNLEKLMQSIWDKNDGDPKRFARAPCSAIPIRPATTPTTRR